MEITKTDKMEPWNDGPSDFQNQLAVPTGTEFPFVLPVPREEDDLEATARKLRGLADMVTAGRSLALAAGEASSKPRRNAEAFAKERMTVIELAQYEEWKQQKFPLPEFDWTANRVPVVANNLKTFSQRAAAMNIIWQRDDATPENAAWLTNFVPRMAPLLKAVTKLSTAEAHLDVHDPYSRMTEDEIAELEAIRTVIAVVDKNVARERERMRKLTESISESQAMLRGRLASLGK